MLADLLNGGNDGGGSEGLGGIQMVGLVNALKTGNVVLDMIIAMTVPVVLKLLFNAISNLHTTLARYDWTSCWWWRRSCSRVAWIAFLALVVTTHCLCIFVTTPHLAIGNHLATTSNHLTTT